MTKQSAYTRNDYMDGKCSHRDYYAQFVTPAIRACVAQVFGRDKLARSLAGDEHFNNIDLAKWDALEHVTKPCTPHLRAAGDNWSMAGSVCILKEAARQQVAA